MFKKLWNKIDGKKTLSGLVVTAVGGLMFLTPVTAPYASEVVIAGASTIGAGMAHKGYKKIKQREEVNE